MQLKAKQHTIEGFAGAEPVDANFNAVFSNLRVLASAVGNRAATSELADLQAMVDALLPPGMVTPFAGATAPDGWLLCDGSTVSQTTYVTLFAVLGTTYNTGGEAAGTFRLPDLRQRFPLGKAAAGAGSALGASGGAIDHTHTQTPHVHAVSIESSAANGSGGSVNIGAAMSVADDLHTHSVAGDTAPCGASVTGTANPPFLALNFIIKF